MRAIPKILFVIILIGLAYFFIRGIPIYNHIQKCLDQKIANFDDVEFRTRADGWSESKRCELEKEHIVTMETCLDETKQTDLPIIIWDIVSKIAGMFHPQSGDAAIAEVQFNESCALYPSLLFPTPTELPVKNILNR